MRCGASWRHRYVGARGRLVPGARGLLVLGLVLATLCGCRATGGGIPGIEPPKPAPICACRTRCEPDCGRPAVRTCCDGEVWPRPNDQSGQHIAEEEQHLCRRPWCRPDRLHRQGAFAETTAARCQAGRVREEVGRLLDEELCQAARRARHRAQHSQGEGVPPHDQDAVRTVRPAGCAGLLLLGHPDHLLAGERATTATRRTRSPGSGISGLSLTNSAITCRQPAGCCGEYGQRSFAVKSRGQRYLLSRRLELQAQCFEGVFLATTARSLRLSSNDRYQLRVWHTYTGDEDPPAGRKPDHGSSAAQIRWLNRGLDSADFGRCNTWTASKKSVK